jgi:hypothetical protein
LIRDRVKRCENNNNNNNKLTNNDILLSWLTTMKKYSLQRIQLFKLQSSLHLYLSRCQERGETSRDIIFYTKYARAFYTISARFTRSGKTRICLWKRRKVYFAPYPRFTRSGKTRIWCLKRILEKNRSSVRPSVRISVLP